MFIRRIKLAIDFFADGRWGNFCLVCQQPQMLKFNGLIITGIKLNEQQLVMSNKLKTLAAFLH